MTATTEAGAAWPTEIVAKKEAEETLQLERTTPESGRAADRDNAMVNDETAILQGEAVGLQTEFNAEKRRVERGGDLIIWATYYTYKAWNRNQQRCAATAENYIWFWEDSFYKTTSFWENYSIPTSLRHNNITNIDNGWTTETLRDGVTMTTRRQFEDSYNGDWTLWPSTRTSIVVHFSTWS